MLQLEHISFSVPDGREILHDVNLTLDERMTVITGPNGSGKSTLAKIIMGINKPSSGRILLNGEDITACSVTERAKRGISFALQQPVRFKGITVRDMLSMAHRSTLTRAQACSYLSEVGMCAEEYVNREIDDSLSGGELKRIEIASVIARGTAVTVFDEPEAGIDLWSFRNLIRVFEHLRTTAKGSILIISHQERIFAACDRILLLENGVIAADGSREEMLPRLAQSGPACTRCTEPQAAH